MRMYKTKFKVERYIFESNKTVGYISEATFICKSLISIITLTDSLFFFALHIQAFFIFFSSGQVFICDSPWTRR